MIVKRYLNGKSIEQDELASIVIDSDLIVQIIADVNRRLQANGKLKRNSNEEQGIFYPNACVV